MREQGFSRRGTADAGSATPGVPAASERVQAAGVPVAPAPPRASAAGNVSLDAAWAAQQGVPPHELRPYRPAPGWLRAAALIALLTAAVLLVPAVRAWIAGVFEP